MSTHPEEGMETFICDTFVPNVVKYSDIPLLLKPELLEHHPHTYKFLLEQYAAYRNPDDVLDSAFTDNPDLMVLAMNDTERASEAFSASPVQCLVYLAGEHSDYSKVVANQRPPGCWYGQSNTIDEDLAMDILDRMISYGAITNIPNSFGENAIQSIRKTDTITGRVNNERFKELLMSYDVL